MFVWDSRKTEANLLLLLHILKFFRLFVNDRHSISTTPATGMGGVEVTALVIVFSDGVLQSSLCKVDIEVAL